MGFLDFIFGKKEYGNLLFWCERRVGKVNNSNEVESYIKNISIHAPKISQKTLEGFKKYLYKRYKN